MSGRAQAAVSALVLAAAVTVVFFQLREPEVPEDPMAATGDDHDHAAMMAAAGGERQPVVLDAEAARRIGVQYAAVRRMSLPLFVRTVGTVTYDERRLATVSPKIDGWVERLHVDFTGAPVRTGDPLMEVYSPALVSAQEELLLATRLAREASAGRALDNAEELLAAARRRLDYWDIPEDEIRRIEESGAPTKTLTLRSPATGVVVEKNVVEGDRIMPGMTVYRIADLSSVWIEADVFEKDLGVVEVGQGAVLSFEAFPGRTFSGRVTYVHPTVSVQSRTGRIRLELPNPAGELKPGMYGEIQLRVPPVPPTLVVPRSALIDTGRRTLVFVVRPDGALEPREVRTGRTSGALQEILEGVEEGDRVVASAAFLVDAESNLGTMVGEMGEMETDAPDSAGGMSGMDHSNH